MYYLLFPTYLFTFMLIDSDGEAADLMYLYKVGDMNVKYNTINDKTIIQNNIKLKL